MEVHPIKLLLHVKETKASEIHRYCIFWAINGNKNCCAESRRGTLTISITGNIIICTTTYCKRQACENSLMQNAGLRNVHQLSTSSLGFWSVCCWVPNIWENCARQHASAHNFSCLTAIKAITVWRGLRQMTWHMGVLWHPERKKKKRHDNM